MDIHVMKCFVSSTFMSWYALSYNIKAKIKQQQQQQQNNKQTKTHKNKQTNKNKNKTKNKKKVFCHYLTLNSIDRIEYILRIILDLTN